MIQTNTITIRRKKPEMNGPHAEGYGYKHGGTDGKEKRRDATREGEGITKEYMTRKRVKKRVCNAITTMNLTEEKRKSESG